MEITLLILFWPVDRGLPSQFYIFYYPFILTFAFVSVARNSIIYTVFALVLYTAACLFVDTSVVLKSIWLERLVIRLITIAAMGLLGAYYWRIQRSGLRAEMGPELEPA